MWASWPPNSGRPFSCMTRHTSAPAVVRLLRHSPTGLHMPPRPFCVGPWPGRPRGGPAARCGDRWRDPHLVGGRCPRRSARLPREQQVAQRARAGHSNWGWAGVVIDSMVEMDRIETAGRRRSTGSHKSSFGSIRASRPIPTEYLRTGAADSKFGITTEGGRAETAVERARGSSAMDVIGIHAHVGEPGLRRCLFERAIEVIARFAAPLDIEELSIGGGLGVAYVEGETAPTIPEWGKAVIDAAHRRRGTGQSWPSRGGPSWPRRR